MSKLKLNVFVIGLFFLSLLSSVALSYVITENTAGGTNTTMPSVAVDLEQPLSTMNEAPANLLSKKGK